MIVRDEERFLAGAIASVAGIVDEVCIVDTGSTDSTREIARAHGARVIDVAWEDDFSAARNAALALATYRWIMVLDADERLESGSRDTLRAIGQQPATPRGKWLTCHNLSDDYQGSGAMSNALVRIFPNDARIRYRNPIHEYVALDGNGGGLPADRTTIAIVHHGYLGAIVTARAKGARNLRLSQRAAERDPDDSFHQYNLGMASLLAGDRDAAIVALDRARELTRTAPRGFRVHALVTLADLYARHRHDTRTAYELVHECLALVPTYSNAHFTHGQLLARDGKWFAARDAFGRAIAAGAHDAEQFVVDNEIAIWKAHSEIGATLMHERRFAEALAWFELASRARPDAAPLVINRAKCHEELGDLAAAATLFAAAAARYHDAGSAIEWINFLLRRGRTGEALTAIEDALPRLDEDARTLCLGTAAAVHLRAGASSRARDCIDRAVGVAGRPAVAERIECLAEHLGVPELAALVGAGAGVRAPAFTITYHDHR